MTQRMSVTENDVVSPDEGWWSAFLADEAWVHQETEVSTNRHVTAGVEVDWPRLLSIFNNDEVVDLFVRGYNRGGLLVEGNGVQGFVPVSHLVSVAPNISDRRRQKALAAYVGRTIKLKVIECEPEEERVVFSERAALAGEGQRKRLFRSLKPGDVVEGCVTNITDFGIFLDLGGLEGLVHVSELSWGRVQDPKSVSEIGDSIEAVVLDVNEDSGRVALSVKQLSENPWDTLEERHTVGEELPAVISAVTRFGAFARLHEGIDGLIHISCIVLPPNIRDLRRYLLVGQEVVVSILHMDAAQRRLGLRLVSV